MSAALSLGLDDDLMVRLNRRAPQHGRSAEAEVRDILRHALAEDSMPPLSDMSDRTFEELAAELRAQTAGRVHTPAEILVGESRDER